MSALSLPGMSNDSERLSKTQGRVAIEVIVTISQNDATHTFCRSTNRDIDPMFMRDPLLFPSLRVTWAVSARRRTQSQSKY